MQKQNSKEISEAYEILSDPQKRAAYDQYGHAGTDPNYGGGYGGGFGGFNGGDSPVAALVDLKTSLNHSLAAVAERQIQMLRDKELICNMLWIFLSKKRFLVWKKNIQYNREETCHTCGGNGAKPGTQPETCQNVMAQVRSMWNVKHLLVVS